MIHNTDAMEQMNKKIQRQNNFWNRYYAWNGELQQISSNTSMTLLHPFPFRIFHREEDRCFKIVHEMRGAVAGETPVMEEGFVL